MQEIKTSPKTPITYPDSAKLILNQVMSSQRKAVPVNSPGSGTDDTMAGFLACASSPCITFPIPSKRPQWSGFPQDTALVTYSCGYSFGFEPNSLLPPRGTIWSFSSGIVAVRQGDSAPPNDQASTNTQGPCPLRTGCLHQRGGGEGDVSYGYVACRVLFLYLARAELAPEPLSEGNAYECR